MKLLRERAFFLVTLLIVIACYLLAGYVEWRRIGMKSELAKHRFDHAMVIAVQDKAPGRLADNDSARLMFTPPTMAAGPLAVLSRKTAAQLQAMPEVARWHLITRTEQKLTLGNALASDVSVFYVSKSFIEAFRLGDPALLQPGVFVPSRSLQQRLSPTANINNATLGITGDLANILDQMKVGGDLARFKVPCRLSAQAFDFPGGATAFDHTLFTTGEPIRFSLPGGIEVFNKIWLVVEFKAGVDLAAARQKLAQWSAEGHDLYDEQNLTITPLSQYFAQQLTLDYLDQWAARLMQGMSVITLLLLLLLTLTRFTRVRRETALRQAMGAGLWAAAWLSTKSTVLAILAALAVGTLLALLAAVLVESALLPALLPLVTGMALLALLCVVLLQGSSVLAGRGALMTQLKGAW